MCEARHVLSLFVCAVVDNISTICTTTNKTWYLLCEQLAIRSMVWFCVRVFIFEGMWYVYKRASNTATIV